MQASINAQRKNSVSIVRRRLSHKNGHFPENIFTSPPPDEDEKNPISSRINDTQENSQERAMLLRYVFAWSDLSTAYQQEGYFNESLDCIESASLIYERLLMYPHLANCLGQFYLALNMKEIDDLNTDNFIEPENEKLECDPYVKGTKYQNMKMAESTLKQTGVPELCDYYEIYLAAYLIQKNKFSKAREILENCSVDIEEMLFFKAIVYNKMQILTSQKICLDMLSPENQAKYMLLQCKEINSNLKVQAECEKLKAQYFQDRAGTISLLEYKKSVYKEILLKVGENLKQILCGYVAQNKEIYMECENFNELLLSRKSLEDCLLVLGHIIRVWLLMPNHAIAFYEQAASLNNMNATPLFFLGVTYRGKNQPEKAVEMYQKALSVKPTYPDCLFNLGNIYLEHYQNMEEAEKCYSAALSSLKIEEEYELTPENSPNTQTKSIITKGRVCNLLGETYKQWKLIIKSAEQYMEGIKEEHIFIDNYIDLADILRMQKLDELAIISEYMGKICATEENKLSYEEEIIINQSLKNIKTNYSQQIYDADSVELIQRLYKTLDYLLLNALLSESRTEALKNILFQLSFAKE